MTIHETLIYLKTNWFQLVVDFIAGINVAVAGAKAMGWNNIANEFEKIESAIIAMVSAALNRNKQNGGTDAKTNNTGGDSSAGGTGTGADSKPN